MRLSTRLLIPWILFCAILVTGFTYFQSQFNQVQTELNLQLQLMQDSVRYARELRFLSQERLTLAMGYREGPLAPVFNELTASENRTNTLILHFEELLNSNAQIHRNEVYGYQGLYLLKTYSLARQNLPQLFREWLQAVSQHSDLEPIKRMQVNQLFMTVRASLDDLAEFHEISQQLINADARAQLRKFQITFYFSMGFLLLLLLGFFAGAETALMPRSMESWTTATGLPVSGAGAGVSTVSAHGGIPLAWPVHAADRASRAGRGSPWRCRSRTWSVPQQAPDGPGVLAHHLQCVSQSSNADDGRAMLIVMKNRNV